LVRRRVVVLGLIEEEVGSELLVLVASEVSLDGLITVKAEAT
jgi:hypothetical protein